MDKTVKETARGADLQLFKQGDIDASQLWEAGYAAGKALNGVEPVPIEVKLDAMEQGFAKAGWGTEKHPAERYVHSQVHTAGVPDKSL